jgi:hypothetical protein
MRSESILRTLDRSWSSSRARRYPPPEDPLVEVTCRTLHGRMLLRLVPPLGRPYPGAAVPGWVPLAHDQIENNGCGATQEGVRNLGSDVVHVI